MAELSVLPQPYPDGKVWVDLRPYLQPSWERVNPSYHARGMIDGNTATIHLRLRHGTSQFIFEDLPEPFQTPTNMMFPASSADVDGKIHLLLRNYKELILYTPGRNIADGTMENLIAQFSYTRKTV
ncbi:hypothetical protein [Glutamicibacter ardleyensis]|uniref:hypothetical protein n=1 Tax=Glutamicibacter ardleyensis TaxID=225894 RepID=UPI003FD62018